MNRWIYFCLLLVLFFSWGPLAPSAIAWGLLCLVVLFEVCIKKWPGGLFLKSLWSESNVRGTIKAALALLLICSLSLVWAAWNHPVIHGQILKQNWIHDLKKLRFLFYPYILGCSFVFLPKRYFQKLLEIGFVLAFFQVLLGLIQHWWPIPFSIPVRYADVGSSKIFHAVGLTGFHLSFASMIIFPLFIIYTLSIDWFFSSNAIQGIEVHQKPSFIPTKNRGFLLIVLSVLFTLVTFWTYSRSLWMTWLILTPCFLLSFFFSRTHFSWSKVGSLLGLLMLPVIYALSRPEVWSGLSLARGFSEGEFIHFRWVAARVHWAMFREHPLLGIGWRLSDQLGQTYIEKGIVQNVGGDPMAVAAKYNTTAHNLFLHQMSSTGLLGLAAMAFWIFFWLRLLKKALKYARNPLERAWVSGAFWGFLALLFNGLTQVNLWDSYVQYVLVWMFGVSLYITLRDSSFISRIHDPQELC